MQQHTLDVLQGCAPARRMYSVNAPKALEFFAASIEGCSLLGATRGAIGAIEVHDSVFALHAKSCRGIRRKSVSLL